MLVEFRLKNYGCFRDEQALSMVASADKLLTANIIEPEAKSISKLRLVRSAIIYGPNASGKTRLLHALHIMQMFVLESDRLKPDEKIEFTPYLFDANTASTPSHFEITFLQEGIRYQYGFVFDQDRVHREYLNATPRGRTVPYFDRRWDQGSDTETYAFGASLKGQNQEIREMTGNNTLFLSVAAARRHPMLTPAYQWFAHRVTGVKSPVSLLPYRRLKDDYHAGVRTLLMLADLGITDYTLSEEKIALSGQGSLGDEPHSEATAAQGPREFKRVRAEMIHPTNTGGSVLLPIEQESDGTKQIFFLAPFVLEALEKGQVLFVDELNASLHPLLTRAILRLFHDSESNKHNAQLIFNTHDTSLLDPAIFRRDQIWFTEKDPDGASHLYSLLEYSPRKGESLAKGYLQGRYGAVPFLEDVSPLNQEECV